MWLTNVANALHQRYVLTCHCNEQADARLLSVSRPDMTDEQVGAIIDDVVAVIEGGTSAELEALPADISEACTSREVLESLIRARP